MKKIREIFQEFPEQIKEACDSAVEIMEMLSGQMKDVINQVEELLEKIKSALQIDEPVRDQFITPKPPLAIDGFRACYLADRSRHPAPGEPCRHWKLRILIYHEK